MARKKKRVRKIAINESEVIRLYREKEESLASIAEKYNTYPNKILRILKKNGIKRRSNSESQKIGIKHGRKEAPNDGSPRSESVCKAISEGMSTYWQNADESVLEAHRERARVQWENMSDEEKQERGKKARKGILNAAKEGSHAEQIVRKCLEDNGIRYIRNKTGMLKDPKQELDLFLPKYSVAIEVDGIYHHQAIHGEKYLQKRKRADYKKNGLCKRAGIHMLRINILRKNPSKKNFRDMCEKLIFTLENLPKEVKLLKIDIK